MPTQAWARHAPAVNNGETGSHWHQEERAAALPPTPFSLPIAFLRLFYTLGWSRFATDKLW